MRFRYTRRALVELEQILNSIQTESVVGSVNVKKRIHEVVSYIADFPFVGRKTRNPRIRRIKVSPYPYLVFYEIRHEAVVVIAIRHGARNPQTMPDAS